ncbi:peroxiredoxin family protein [Chitinimonas lacunae]|uniref:Peroxiredoxin family protein n=1 Tax=Chitinimonas lacunae TaxID=1963018 RepID=A0ABV8MQR1_9NEIS
MKVSVKHGLLLGLIGALSAGVLIFGSQAEQLAPAVTYSTLSGARIEQTALKGKVVLVNFWATSCTGCMKEMPKLVQTHHKFAARGYETVAVAMSYDRPDYVQTYTNTNKLPFKVALDLDGSIAQRFGEVKLTPTTFLIDKRGRIVQRFLGEPDFNTLEKLIEQKLAESV